MTMPTAGHLQLGSCDYPEQTPQHNLSASAQQQRELGLSVVRLAEFAWSTLEPHPKEFAWEWLDNAVNTYAAAGLHVVLCTPTATPPAWLTHAHPEILAVDDQGRAREFGSRRHYDFASGLYREHSRRITLALARRYGNHPAVVGWQTDNEFACHATGRSYGGASAAAFPGWLERKYGSLEALNLAWGNAFWSMDYTDWAQVKPPILTVTQANPAHLLDYYRFCSQQIAEFQAEQVGILREHSPGRFITHNFMIFESGFDHYQVARGLDFATWDNYPTGMLELFAPASSQSVKAHYARTGHPDLVAFHHDLYRGVTGKPIWVMEQQCGQVNWAPHNPLPADGAVQLWTAQAWAHGADVVNYFRWQAAKAGQEILHSGLLRHDGTPDRGYAEVQGLNLNAFLLGALTAKVALLHDYESLWLIDMQPHSEGLSYWAQVMAYYTALRSQGIDVDVLPANADLSAYTVVVAPALTLVTPQQAEQFKALAAAGQRLVFGPRTAFRTPSGGTWETGQFGPLAALIGASLLNFDSLRPGLNTRVEYGEGRYSASHWAESYRLSGAAALAHYEGGPLHGQAAVIRRGHVTVIGAHDQELISTVLSEVLMNAGIAVISLPEGVRLSRRAGCTLVQNWNEQAVKWQGRTLYPVSFEVVAGE